VTQQQNPFSTVSKPRRGGGLLLTVTLVVAVLGLVVGVAGVAVASIALGRSDKAVNLAGSVRAVPPPAPADPTTAPTGDPTPTPADSTQDTDGADPSATPTEIDPSAQFSVAYQGQNLRIRSVGCNSSTPTYVDLDEPRILLAQSQGSEFGYNDCDPGQIHSDLLFAQVSGPNATPAELPGDDPHRPGAISDGPDGLGGRNRRPQEKPLAPGGRHGKGQGIGAARGPRFSRRH
jgi:hypothetical protein